MNEDEFEFPWRAAEAATRNAKRAKKPIVSHGTAAPARSCRLNMRLTKSEKAKLEARARATKRTVTSIISELIAGMK